MARETKKAEAIKLDLTPMIDCTFQLIIFFILTMTISSKNLKDVTLPSALTAVEEKTDEKGVFMIHIFNRDQDSRSRTKMPPVESWEITHPKSSGKEMIKTVEQLTKVLDYAVKDYKEMEEPAPGVKASKLTVLVRGDMRAPSHFFSVILAACFNVRVWKVQVSIAPPPDVIARTGGA